MKLLDFAPIGVLAVSCPLLLYASTLSAEVACKQALNPNNPQQVIATPVARKTDLYPFFFIASVASGGLACALAWKHWQAEQEPELLPALAASDRPPVRLPAPSSTADQPIERPIERPIEPSNKAIEPDPEPVRLTAALESVSPAPPAVQPANPQPIADKPSLIRSIAASRLSIVWSAPPGCGKTTTELAWLGHLFSMYPDAQVYVVTWKNDSFLGLSSVPGAVEVLGDRGEDGIDWSPLMRQLNKVLDVLNHRRQLPLEQRSEFVGKPCYLLLGDYYATVAALSRSKKYGNVWEDLRSGISSLITVGREFLCGVVVDTHSFNVASLGLADSNIRDCLTINALGKITRDENGREDGGFGAIFKAINNEAIVDDPAVRSQLLKELAHLQRQSDATGQPVMFSSLGHPPRLVLLPDLRKFERLRLPDGVLQRIAYNMGTAVRVRSNSANQPPTPVRLLSNSPEVLPDEDPDELELTGSSSTELPNWYEELPERARKMLYLSVRSNLDSGHSRSAIIKGILGCKSEKYPEGALVFDDLMARYGGGQA